MAFTRRGRSRAGSPLSVIQQPEFHDPLDFIYPADFKIEVLGEVMPSKGTSRSVLPTEDPVLGVTRVGKVFAVVGSSELAFPSLMTAPKLQGASSGLSLLLRRGDNEVALGHGNFRV